jgi:hypothetical protein
LTGFFAQPLSASESARTVRERSLIWERTRRT